MLKGYIEGRGNSKRLGLLLMARDLMRTDRVSLKRGYSAENAYIAVIEQAAREQIELTADDKAALALALSVDAAALESAFRG